MILLQKLSGRMSEPLRASFHQNTLFLKMIVSAKLKSYISVFGILIKLI